MQLINLTSEEREKFLMAKSLYVHDKKDAKAKNSDVVNAAIQHYINSKTKGEHYEN